MTRLIKEVGHVDRRAIAILAIIVACVVALAAGFAIAVRVDDTGSVGITGPNTSTSEIFIAVDPTITGAHMDALFEGPIIVRHDCVLMGGGSGRPSLPIWPHGFTTSETDGRVVVQDESGNIVVSDGQDLSMGGGYVAEFYPTKKVIPKDYQVTKLEQSLGFTIPDRCLTGIYGIWGVGEIDASSASPTTASD